MKLIHLLLTIALIVSLTGCDLFDDPNIAKLEARITQLEESNAELQARWDEQSKVQTALVSELTKELADTKEENEELKGHIDSLQTVIAKMEDTQPAKDDTLIVKFAHNKLYNTPATNTLTEKVMAVYKPGKVKITINGYSSKAGPEKLNRWFSKERAEGVAHKLFQLGVIESDVKIISHGETDDDERKVVVTIN